MTPWKPIPLVALLFASTAWAGGSELTGLLLLSVKDLDKVKDVYEFALEDDTGTLQDGTGCEMKTLVKMYAAPVDPGLGFGSDNPVDFLCYKMACPGSPKQTLTVTDFNGTRSVEVKKPKLFCTPG